MINHHLLRMKISVHHAKKQANTAFVNMMLLEFQSHPFYHSVKSHKQIYSEH